MILGTNITRIDEIEKPQEKSLILCIHIKCSSASKWTFSQWFAWRSVQDSFFQIIFKWFSSSSLKIVNKVSIPNQRSWWDEVKTPTKEGREGGINNPRRRTSNQPFLISTIHTQFSTQFSTQLNTICRE